MKSIRQDLGDSMRPEYKRSDFGEAVQGKYAATQLQFAEVVCLLLACIGEDEGLKFISQPQGSLPAGRKAGDWTYELDAANQVTLRYWLSEFESIDESISNRTSVNSAQERSDLQNLLFNHVRILKTRVEPDFPNRLLR